MYSKKSDFYFGELVKSPLSNWLKKYENAKIVVFVDTNTHDHCLEYLLTTYTELMEAEVIALPAGEENKVIEVCHQVWSALSEYQIKRNDLVINLGGGLVTDMGGFIASIYKRGLKFINIPTSLLGMVDASVGGKTGVDLAQYKNQLGVFAFPELVIFDPAFLQTLPEEEFLAGKAEMYKHALIAGEKHWDLVEKLTKGNIQIDVIEQSVNIKKSIVESDPYESGERKKLNLGHTIGHAFEGVLLTKEPTPHGFCVAWGILVEALLAYNSGFLSEKNYEKIKAMVERNYPQLNLDKEDIVPILSLLQNDKKNEGNDINFSLIRDFGNIDINYSFSIEAINEALNQFLK